MPEVATPQMMATELLAMLIAYCSEKFDKGEGIGGSGFRQVGDTGVSATIHLPEDMAFDIVINYLGPSSDILANK